MQYEEKNPKTFWKLLNDLKGKKQNNTGWMDKILSKATQHTNRWQHWWAIINKFNCAINSSKQTQILDKPFTLNEIHSGIQNLKSNKAQGLDAISNREVIKTGAYMLAPYMCKR